MAIDKSAVREGTRWFFRGGIVVVDEVTSRSVVWFVEGIPSLCEVTSIQAFADGAFDPATAEHDELSHYFGNLPQGVQTGHVDKVHQAIRYILGRLGSPAPANPLSAPAVAHPVLDVAEPLPIVVAEPEPVAVEEGPVCSLAEPDYCFAVADLPDDRPLKKRRYA